MIQQFIVPIDGSPESWRAFDVAVALGERCGREVHIVHISADPLDGRQANADLRLELDRRGSTSVEVTIDVRLSIGTIASELEAVLELNPGAVLVMSSHGKGRSAAFVGSVTEDTLERTFGPVVLVGPHATVRDLSGPIIVTVDGSHESEAALPLAAAWGIELGATPWIVNVADSKTSMQQAGSDTVETAYAARLAAGLSTYSGHEVEFDELHGRHPERAVAEYASRHDASLIVASSHGRSGLSRLAVGSVTAGLVRTAECPVVVVRLPQPLKLNDEASATRRIWAY